MGFITRLTDAFRIIFSPLFSNAFNLRYSAPLLVLYSENSSKFSTIYNCSGSFSVLCVLREKYIVKQAAFGQVLRRRKNKPYFL